MCLVEGSIDFSCALDGSRVGVSQVGHVVADYGGAPVVHPQFQDVTSLLLALEDGIRNGRHWTG